MFAVHADIPKKLEQKLQDARNHCIWWTACSKTGACLMSEVQTIVHDDNPVGLEASFSCSCKLFQSSCPGSYWLCDSLALAVRCAVATGSVMRGSMTMTKDEGRLSCQTLCPNAFFKTKKSEGRIFAIPLLAMRKFVTCGQNSSVLVKGLERVPEAQSDHACFRAAMYADDILHDSNLNSMSALFIESSLMRSRRVLDRSHHKIRNISDKSPSTREREA